MLTDLSAFIERHELQWCLYFILGAVTLVRVPEILSEEDIGSLRSTCGIYHHHVCISEGCFFEPTITSIGQPRAKMLGDETPTHVEILYKVSYFRSASRIIKTKTSINCLQNYKHPTMSNIYIALIPAILTALFIIGLLIFLKPSSEVYYLVDNKEEEETAQFTIDDDSDEEICTRNINEDDPDDEEVYRTDRRKVQDIEEDPFVCESSCTEDCDKRKQTTKKIAQQIVETNLDEHLVSDSKSQHIGETNGTYLDVQPAIDTQQNDKVSVDETVICETTQNEKAVGKKAVGEKAVGETTQNEKGVGETTKDRTDVRGKAVDETVIGEMTQEEKAVGETTKDEIVVGEECSTTDEPVSESN